MKISVLSASHRKNSQSERVSHYILKHFSQNLSLGTGLISLAQNPLPLFDEELFLPENLSFQNIWKPLSKTLAESDGFVFVCPEWHGMVPAGFKNLFLFCCSGYELAHKPALIVAVSAGAGGSYVVNELRTSGYKNSRICYLPEHVIIRDCQKALQSDQFGDDASAKRLKHCLELLVEYAKALRLVRESGVIDFKSYPTGM